MTAKNYYTKYKNCFFVDNISIPVTEFTTRLVVEDFLREARKNADVHFAIRDGSLLSILEEQDGKWQALCRIFELKHGFSPLRKEDFTYWAQKCQY